jgi:hypothetical protein
MASLCGTFSQFQSGPKPESEEFGNRAANNRSITAIVAHRSSAMRSRELIGAYGQIIFYATTSWMRDASHQKLRWRRLFCFWQINRWCRRNWVGPLIIAR